VTPLALWTHVLLKGGEAMLDTMQAAVKRARPGVAVIPTPDAPTKRVPAAARKSKLKAKVRAKPAPKQKARARSARASARRR
jgi:hypothetical protein